LKDVKILRYKCSTCVPLVEDRLRAELYSVSKDVGLSSTPTCPRFLVLSPIKSGEGKPNRDGGEVPNKGCFLPMGGSNGLLDGKNGGGFVDNLLVVPSVCCSSRRKHSWSEVSLVSPVPPELLPTG
jgi:hypothetical protein